DFKCPAAISLPNLDRELYVYAFSSLGNGFYFTRHGEFTQILNGNVCAFARIEFCISYFRNGLVHLPIVLKHTAPKPMEILARLVFNHPKKVIRRRVLVCPVFDIRAKRLVKSFATDDLFS